MFQRLQNIIELKVTADLIGHGSLNNVKALIKQLGMISSDVTLSFCNEKDQYTSDKNRYGSNVNYQLSTFSFYKAFKETLIDELNALSLTYDYNVNQHNINHPL